MDKPVKGVVIKPDGTFTKKEFKQLTDYQEAVEGFFTTSRLYDYAGEQVACCFVDDEGLLKGLPLNPIASAISFIFNGNPYLAGNVVVLGATNEQGEDTDIPEQLLWLIEKVCRTTTDQRIS